MVMGVGIAEILPAITIGVLVATPGGVLTGGGAAHVVHRLSPTETTACPRRARLLGATLGAAYPTSVAACNIALAGVLGRNLLPTLFAIPAAYAVVAVVAGGIFAAQYPCPAERSTDRHRRFQAFAGGTYAVMLCLVTLAIALALLGADGTIPGLAT